MKEVLIKTENINLDKFLKWAGVFSTGGEAKIFIGQGDVKVNGQVELKRSRKLSEGDQVEFAGEKYAVVRGG